MTIRPYTQSHPRYTRGWDFLFLTTAVSTVPCHIYRLPLRRCCHPAAIFQQSRAEVGPNSYARGDHIRPCYAGLRSVKREPAYRKTKHIPERVFPTRRGISRCLLSATSFNCCFTHTQKDIASRFFKIFHLILFYPYAKGYHALPCAYPCREHGFFMRKGYRFKNSPLSPAGILVPYGGVATPLQYLSDGRAEVRPNLNARGDCRRPCCARQRSLKRELCVMGKRTAFLKKFSPCTGDTATG
jgi:hypothetical protein